MAGLSFRSIGKLEYLGTLDNGQALKATTDRFQNEARKAFLDCISLLFFCDANEYRSRPPSPGLYEEGIHYSPAHFTRRDCPHTCHRYLSILRLWQVVLRCAEHAQCHLQLRRSLQIPSQHSDDHNVINRMAWEGCRGLRRSSRRTFTIAFLCRPTLSTRFE